MSLERASGPASGSEVTAHTAMHVRGRSLVVPVPPDSEAEGLAELGDAILARMRARNLTGLVLDLGAVAIIDADAFRTLAKISDGAGLFGARTVWVGIQPGVAAALVDLDVDLTELIAARNVRRGTDLLGGE